jgi:hypothetical protein
VAQSRRKGRLLGTRLRHEIIPGVSALQGEHSRPALWAATGAVLSKLVVMSWSTSLHYLLDGIRVGMMVQSGRALQD